MAEYKGLEYLRNKLLSKRIRVLTRYAYYEMKNGIMDYSKLMPADMRWIKATLGWCSKAVDSVADRLAFREFRNDNFDLNNIFDMNNPDTFHPITLQKPLFSTPLTQQRPRHQSPLNH